MGASFFVPAIKGINSHLRRCCTPLPSPESFLDLLPSFCSRSLTISIFDTHQHQTIAPTMSVTDETKAVAPEATTAPAEAPTKEVEKAVDAPVEEKKEEETKVSLCRRVCNPGANHVRRHCFIVLLVNSSWVYQGRHASKHINLSAININCLVCL